MNQLEVILRRDPVRKCSADILVRTIREVVDTVENCMGKRNGGGGEERKNWGGRKVGMRQWG